MQKELSEHSERLSKLFVSRAKRFYGASLFIKISLIAFASALVAIAGFMRIPEGSSYTAWQIVGIAAAMVVVVGSILVIIIEGDSSSELHAAREAVEEIRSEWDVIRGVIDQLEELDVNASRARQLYLAMMAMRGVIEQTASMEKRSVIGAIETLMKAAERPLKIAAGFEQSDQWTICIYEAESDPATQMTELVCKCHRRAIQCDISEARTWPAGVGAAGVAFSSGKEVIVPDLLAPELGTIFSLGDRTRAYDSDRYRSIVAHPILLDSNDLPWGVIVATSDKPEHFGTDEVTGVKTAEAVRALAGMVALAVTVCDA